MSPREVIYSISLYNFLNHFFYYKQNVKEKNCNDGIKQRGIAKSNGEDQDTINECQCFFRRNREKCNLCKYSIFLLS